jgi:hypothetical protein
MKAKFAIDVLTVIPAKQAREGMTMAFVNERFNYVIEDVQHTRDGEVKIVSSNDTRVEYFGMDENIWVYMGEQT